MSDDAEDAIAEADALARRHGPCAVCQSVLVPATTRVLRARGRPAEADALAARAAAVLGPTTNRDA